ncbi:glutathione S-transferase family protein [Fortiea sp. LEGE XX443]|uniref:glutathione S-transferase family protein n=1 Tax=Fortiea sp. LEGE XX443 TaxID=1828611 RepID=UPI0018805EFB|nr:glutathione S-transferase family protein [Fortiea sp. LEGE XX443]MBE9004917.1 glutathione S-transferase family protein [Fortiea sp. LEGE XX443]
MSELILVIGSKNYSSWSLRPWIIMKQFGIQFQEICIPLKQSETTNQILQYSPSGKVPVLIHNSHIVWDSLAICEYLAEVFPEQHWHPKNNVHRAIARSISAEMHSGFQNLRQNMPMNCRAKLPGQGLTLAVQKDIDRIISIWQECRQKFGINGEFLFGKFTIADAFFIPVVMRFVTYNVQLDNVSQNYVNTILSLQVMQEWIAAAKVEADIIPQ